MLGYVPQLKDAPVNEFGGIFCVLVKGKYTGQIPLTGELLGDLLAMAPAEDRPIVQGALDRLKAAREAAL